MFYECTEKYDNSVNTSIFIKRGGEGSSEFFDNITNLANE